MARPTNFGFNRFGADTTKGYVKPELTGGSVGKRYSIGGDTKDYRFRTGGGLKPQPAVDWGTLVGAGIGLANRGGGDAGQYGREDIAAQNKLAKEVWQKTTPDLNYTGGSNKWTQNPDGTWALTSELDEMEQGLYDQSGMLTSTLGDQAQDFFGGGYEGMYQNRLDRLRNQYTAGDAREEAIRRARQTATGASSTGIFQEDANRASLIDQRDLGLINQADLDVAKHGDFLMGNREKALGMLTKTGDISNQFLSNQMTYADPKGNLQNVSDAFTRQMDQEAAYAAKKQKGKDQFWNNILGGGGGGGDTAISYIATATTQAIGEDGLRVFEDWRDYMFYTLPAFTTSFGRYRATAPKIVEEIDKKDNSKALYKEIWDNYLKPIFNLIKKDKDDPKALSDYKIMVRELKNKYLV